MRRSCWALLVALFVAAQLPRPAHASVPQTVLPLVEQMPRLPQPWIPADWASLTRSQLAFVFDAVRQGPYLPLLWWDDRHINVNQTTFGVPS
jgi:hypothetical protein